MRALEHILFFFLFAGELYAYIRTRSLLFFIRGRKFVVSLLYFLLWKKKGFENVLFALRWQVSAVTSSDKGSGPLRVFIYP